MHRMDFFTLLKTSQCCNGRWSSKRNLDVTQDQKYGYPNVLIGDTLPFILEMEGVEIQNS